MTNVKMFRGEREGSFFTTTEVGFSAFVPFSEKWAMDLHQEGAREVGGKSFPSNFSFEPSGQSGGGSMTAGWKKNVEDYSQKAKTNPNVMPILKMMEETPDVRMRSRAAKLSEELGNLLKSPSIYKQYAGDPAEFEEKIVIDWVMDQPAKNWEGSPGWKTLEERGATRDWQKFAGIGGSETLDLASKDDKEAEILEYSLNRMAAHFGDDFVKDVQGIEVTKEAKNKFLQQVYNATDSRLAPEDRLLEAGNTFKDYIMEEQKKVEKLGGSLQKVGENIKGTKMKGGVEGTFVSGEFQKGAAAFMSGNPATLAYSGGGSMETPAYIAQQVIRRFNEIAMNKGSETGAYIYHIPMAEWNVEWNAGKWSRGILPPKGQKATGNRSFMVGFIKLSPIIKHVKQEAILPGDKSAVAGKLTDIVVSAKVSDMSELWAEAQAILSQEEYEKMMEAASSVVYGSFAQWLIYDLAIKSVAKEETMRAAADVLKVTGAKERALTGRRGELIGSSLWQLVEGVSRGAVDGMVDVQAVQTMSTKEITDNIEKQFASFVDTGKNKGWSKMLKAFYEKAIKSSNLVSEQWRNDIGVTNRSAALWRKGPPYLYDGPKSKFGQKMGIPFFFHSGKTPMDYMRFASSFSKGTVPFLNKVTSSTDLPGYSGDKYREMQEIYRGLGWERAGEWTPANKAGGVKWAGDTKEWEAGQGFFAQKSSKASGGYFDTIYG